MIEKKDLEKLSKLHITNVLDLALVVPSRYEDNSIYDFITGYEQTFQAKIISVIKPF